MHIAFFSLYLILLCNFKKNIVTYHDGGGWTGRGGGGGVDGGTGGYNIYLLYSSDS